jgi:hypothetical protein
MASASQNSGHQIGDFFYQFKMLDLAAGRLEIDSHLVRE